MVNPPLMGARWVWRCLLWVSVMSVNLQGGNPAAAQPDKRALVVTVTAAAGRPFDKLRTAPGGGWAVPSLARRGGQVEGRQLVRVSLPFASGMLRDGQGLVASDRRGEIPTGVRVLTRYPADGAGAAWVRRALVTFPYTFARGGAVRFTLKPRAASPAADADFPAQVSIQGETVRIAYHGGPVLNARLLAPARTSTEGGAAETVESNAYFRWQRRRLPDAQWPRVIEARLDALGGVAVVAHLQRNLEGDGRAPDFGWEIEIEGARAALHRGDAETAVTAYACSHPFSTATPCALLFDDGRYRLYHPTAPFERRGRVEVRQAGKALQYRYLRCAAEERVPMQQAAWRRAEFVVAPAELAQLTAALRYPHGAQVAWQAWDALYDTGRPLDLAEQPRLAPLLRYHRDAIVRSAAVGDDWGNVTAYSDDAPAGAVYGMNRLNHCSPIFEEGWRSGDQRLLEAAVLWCDNFYDQSIWWGPGETGGTRYNNIIAAGQTPPDDDRSYMWRSNSAVNFCTKGFESFFLAYEETGDPRMMEALAAQVAYASEQVHADRGEARNVGAARDFVRLYRFTGEQRYLDQGLRLFRELRTKLSAGDLFSQSGAPIIPDPPFIEDDAAGYRSPFAKPYIIGYALAGLPALLEYAPQEPELREAAQAVADFLADSQDPVGGWRYPHPGSSYVIMSQALEHAWQLEQADLGLGAQEKHLDAIERTLRQRVLGWLGTGRVFNGLSGWEIATGKVKDRAELYALYRRPQDRDFTRDYSEGQPEFGSSPPEGLVYFPEVLRFYLERRPASRLLAPPGGEEPLGKVLARAGGAGR